MDGWSHFSGKTDYMGARKREIRGKTGDRESASSDTNTVGRIAKIEQDIFNHQGGRRSILP